jgi:hypothetical protein
MFETDSVIIQPDDNVFIIIHQMIEKNAKEKYHSQVITSMLTFSPMITPNEQAYAVIQLGDNTAIVI